MPVPALNTSAQGISQISADLLNTFLQGCVNITQLRAFVGLSNMVVFVQGYVNPNDGGQGNFYWNSTGTGPDDGGVTNVVPPGVVIGCWSRVSAAAVGNGTVTSVSVVSANGVSGTVANSTTNPAITLSLGAITPSSVAATGAVSGANLTGTNTGDQAITLTGQVTGSGSGTFATTIASNTVTNANFRQSAPLSVVGNNTNSTGNVSDISSSGANQILIVNNAGTGFSFTRSGVNITDLTISQAANTSSTGVLISDPTFTGSNQGYAGFQTSGVTLSGASNFIDVGILIQMPSIVNSTVTSSYGVKVLTPTAIGTSTITVMAGAYIQNMGSSKTTTSYGMQIDAQSGSTTNWSIFDANGFFVKSTKDVIIGTAALSTSATAGFLWIPSCAGAPTGNATAPYSQAVGLVYDTTDNKLYATPNGGATWKSVTLT